MRQAAHSSIEVEHRLTLLEVTLCGHDKRITRNSSRIKAVEDRLPKMSPRDWLMTAAGIATIAAAVAGRLPWTEVLALLAKP